MLQEQNYSEVSGIAWKANLAREISCSEDEQRPFGSSLRLSFFSGGLCSSFSLLQLRGLEFSLMFKTVGATCKI